MKKIISKKYADKLIREGKAKIESEIKPNNSSTVYVAMTRYDNQQTVHFKITKK